MKLPRVAIAAIAVAGLVTVGAAGAVTAAGLDGHGPASVLSGLVKDGTLTQAQADKVDEALKANRDEMHKQGEARRAEVKALVAKTLGISETELTTQREAGKSLAAIAGAKKAELITVLVAHMNSRLDQAVTDGKLTAEQAAKMKAQSQQRVERLVAATGPVGRMGPHGPGRGADGGADAAAAGPAGELSGPPEGAGI